MGAEASLDKVDVPFHIPELKIKRNFNFLEYNCKRTILGNDMLTKLKIRIAFELRAITFEENQLQFYHYSDELNIVEN